MRAPHPFPTNPRATLRRAVDAFDGGDLRGAFDAAGAVITNRGPLGMMGSLVGLMVIAESHPQQTARTLRNILPALAVCILGDTIGLPDSECVAAGIAARMGDPNDHLDPDGDAASLPPKPLPERPAKVVPFRPTRPPADQPAKRRKGGAA